MGLREFLVSGALIVRFVRELQPRANPDAPTPPPRGRRGRGAGAAHLKQLRKTLTRIRSRRNAIDRFLEWVADRLDDADGDAFEIQILRDAVDAAGLSLDNLAEYERDRDLLDEQIESLKRQVEDAEGE